MFKKKQEERNIYQTLNINCNPQTLLMYIGEWTVFIPAVASS